MLRAITPFGLRGPSLVVVFSVACALILAGTAVFIGREISQSITLEARKGAENTAAVFTRLSLEAEEYSDGQITAEGRGDLVHNLRRVPTVVGSTLWTRERRAEIALGRTERQERKPGYRSGAPALTAALAGRIRSELTHRGDPAETLSVYVPVMLETGGPPAGALQVYTPYAPVQAEITHRTRRLFLTLGIAAVLLYLALFPTMLRASRALRSAYEARHVAVQRDLRRAMTRGELELHYQPKIGLPDGSVHGVEALLRWRHPKRGLVPPGAFLPQVESTPLIGPLSLHVFALACRQAAGWRRKGLDLNIAVNMSVANLEDPDLPSKLADLLDEWGLDPHGFTLEVTETAVEQGTENVERVLQRLRAMGFHLSVDDFGTGYSSLARLNQLPVDELKIDRSFTQALDGEDGGDTRLVASIIALAEQLELSCVAEGIESAETAAKLAAMGCETGQGFHWTRPLPAEELTAWALARPVAVSLA